MHSNQQADDNRVVDIFSRHKKARNQVRSSGRLFERPLKTIEKTTSSVKARLTTGEHVGLILAYSKECSGRTHKECCEGYDPGMDADF
jgi:hypothetical protein